MATREGLLAEFDHEMAATRRLLACVPEDRLAWKPHERSRSIAGLAAHIAQITAWSGPILELLRFDLENAPAAPADPATRAELLGLFAASTARARTLIQRSDAELHAMWQLRHGGQELFSLPRAAAFRTFVLGHVVHHRGQLSVYLRLNDIPVPPIYGPTADSPG
ncbi:MAG TPA: DinB family protein [Vicinamibacterales bacterium]|nr:DinB family protein [Vicinamibacterales bacterium]